MIVLPLRALHKRLKFHKNNVSKSYSRYKDRDSISLFFVVGLVTKFFHAGGNIKRRRGCGGQLVMNKSGKTGSIV